MAHPMIVYFICCLHSDISYVGRRVYTATIHIHDNSYMEIVTTVNLSHSGRQTTYKVCHIDIDTSLDEVVDLLHQTILTCLQQFHLLEQHRRERKMKVEGE